MKGQYMPGSLVRQGPIGEAKILDVHPAGFHTHGGEQVPDSVMEDHRRVFDCHMRIGGAPVQTDIQQRPRGLPGKATVLECLPRLLGVGYPAAKEDRKQAGQVQDFHEWDEAKPRNQIQEGKTSHAVNLRPGLLADRSIPPQPPQT
jgi:hypothetical protein